MTIEVFIYTSRLQRVNLFTAGNTVGCLYNTYSSDYEETCFQDCFQQIHMYNVYYHFDGSNAILMLQVVYFVG